MRYGPTAVYRLFNDAGHLIYIGIAIDPRDRLREHRCYQPWGKEIAKMTFEEMPDRASARKLEEQLIKAERPKYNVQLAQGKQKGRSFRVSEELWRLGRSIAKNRGERLSDVIRDALDDYVEQFGEPTRPHDDTTPA